MRYPLNNPTAFLFSIILLMILSVGTIAHAQAAEPDKKKLAGLAQSICWEYQSGGVHMVKEIKYEITRHIRKHQGNPNPTTQDIITFLNTSRDHMVCGEEKKNYMLVALDNNDTEAHKRLFDGLLFSEQYADEVKETVNVNVVSYTGAGGRPQSLIDYMDGIINDKKKSASFRREVSDLRDMFIEDFGGKKFIELPKATQEQYLANKPK